MSINREAFVGLSPSFLSPSSNINPSLRLALSLCEGEDYSGIKKKETFALLREPDFPD